MVNFHNKLFTLQNITIENMRKIKNLLILIPALLLSLSLFAQKASIATISGKIADNNTYKTIYLDTLGMAASAAYIQSEIKEDGGFKIELSIDKTNIYRLRLAENNFLVLIIQPGEKIQVLAPDSKLSIHTKIVGSEHTNILYSAIRKTQVADRALDSLNKAYNKFLGESEIDKSQSVLKQMRAVDSLSRAMLRADMRKNLGSMAWLFLSERLDRNKDFGLIDSIDVELMKKYSKSPYVLQNNEKVNIERKTAVGALAPEIALEDPTGNIRKLSEMKGKLVLLDFWASWCMPCRRANPDIVAIYNKYKDRGFDIFSVSLDKDKTAWLNAIEKDKLSWENHVSDLQLWKSEGALTYGVFSIPAAFLIGKDGKIVAKKLTVQELEAEIIKHLEK